MHQIGVSLEHVEMAMMSGEKKKQTLCSITTLWQYTALLSFGIILLLLCLPMILF
jgi:hypothetical protein